MADLASARVKSAINELIEDIDRSCMREMQRNMHSCSAKCCENTTASMEEVHDCMKNCSKSMTEAQAFLETELTNYQDRIQRCVLRCQDDIRDRITPTTTEAEVGNFKKDFEQCVVKCADEHINLIPSISSRMKEFLKHKLQNS